jgi:hypothetical protein
MLSNERLVPGVDNFEPAQCFIGDWPILQAKTLSQISGFPNMGLVHDDSAERGKAQDIDDDCQAEGYKNPNGTVLNRSRYSPIGSIPESVF